MGQRATKPCTNRDMSGSGGAYPPASHIQARDGYGRERYPYCVRAEL